MLIPFPCVNNSRTLIFKICRPSFSSSNVFLELTLVATPTHFLFGRRTFYFLLSHPRRRVGCDRWRLHWGLVIGLSHSVSVQYFIVTSSLFMFPFLFYLSFCLYLYIIFAMLLCLVCVCLSIIFIVRNIFVLCTHVTYTFAHTLRY